MNYLVTIGPLPFYFGNVNEAMGLRGHHHTALMWLGYGHLRQDHGFPSFLDTNNQLRAELQRITGPRNTFRDATNEVVVQRLFEHFQTFCPSVIADWGGRYWLQNLHIDVEGVQDDIGHDNGATRYTVDVSDPQERVILPPTGTSGTATV